MSTTFILHGGATSKNSRYNDLFFKQFSSLVDKNRVDILMCYWARGKDDWDKLLKRDSEKIKAQTNKNISFSLLKNSDKLVKRMESHDVLYVAGGDAEKIEPTYSRLEDMKKILKNKIYIGSSMGAFMIAKHYVLSFDSQDSESVHNGIGILPINILCHWDVDKDQKRKIKMLRHKSRELPILTLDECMFTTIVF